MVIHAACKVSAAQASVYMLEMPAVIMSTVIVCTIVTHCQQAQTHLAGAAACTQLANSASMLENSRQGHQHQVPIDATVVAW